MPAETSKATEYLYTRLFNSAFSIVYIFDIWRWFCVCSLWFRLFFYIYLFIYLFFIFEVFIFVMFSFCLFFWFRVVCMFPFHASNAIYIFYEFTNFHFSPVPLSLAPAHSNSIRGKVSFWSKDSMKRNWNNTKRQKEKRFFVIRFHQLWWFLICCAVLTSIRLNVDIIEIFPKLYFNTMWCCIYIPEYCCFFFLSSLSWLSSTSVPSFTHARAHVRTR